MPDIKLKNVTVVFKNKEELVYALNNVSVEFESNAFNVIIGYSGSGKTTLLKSIAGLLEYNGSICIDGIESETLELKDKNISYVSQNYVLYPNMTIFDNIAFPLKMMNAPKNEIIERVKDVADKLELSHCLTRKPKHLSGGQQQRVALARALVKRPSICLFDEPLSNLDEQFRTDARIFIKKAMIAYSCTAIYVTHNISEAMALSDKLFLFNEGKIILSGQPLDLYNSHHPVMDSLIKGEYDDIL